MSNTSDERIFIDLRNSLGYTNEMERPNRNDSKLKLAIEKNFFKEKQEA